VAVACAVTPRDAGELRASKTEFPVDMPCLNPHISPYVHTRLGEGMLPARPRLQTGVGAAWSVPLDPCPRKCNPAW